MKLFITLHYPVDLAIRTLLINRSAIPVGTAVSYPEAVLNSLEVPAWMHPLLMEKAAAVATTSATGVLDILTAVMVNALSFAAGFALWGGAFQLAGFSPEPERRPAKLPGPMGRSRYWGYIPYLDLCSCSRGRRSFFLVDPRYRGAI